MKTTENQLSREELQRLRQTDFKRVPGFADAETFLTAEHGAPGTAARADFEAKAHAWYFGEILRNRRKELGLTQKELAEKIGRERTYINRIEKGETDMQLSSFIRIAEALGFSLRLDLK